MHIQSHILSGWCIGNLFNLTPRERLFCMFAASLQDLDGLGIIVSEELYWDLHHKLGHCLLAGMVLSIAFAMFSTHRWKVLPVYLGLFHLHLVMDYFGSGPGWGLYYLWPFSDWEWINRNAWPFFSWQNLSAAAGFLIWAILIAVYQHRTPLELLMPSLDRRFVALVGRKRAATSQAAQVQ